MDLFWFFVGLEGRVGRIGYAVPLALIAFSAAVAVLAAMVLQVRGDAGPVAVLAAAMLALLIVPWVTFALTWKRLHDVGVSGYYAFGLFVPGVALLLIAVLCLWPGEPGANRFGEPEPV